MPSHPLPTSEDLDRARAIVETLPLEQRIALVSGRDVWRTEAVPGADTIMMTDGPHGLRKQLTESDHVGLADSEPATCFPPATTLGSTWDVDLVAEVGAALGAEARATDVAIVLGPGLNIKRHPRGGRCFEYFSEDPHLAGTLAAAMVRGIQSQGVAACPKHFAVNNQETFRMVVDAVVDERTLRELYLRAFELVVRESAPATLMTSYNRINGQYASDSQHLLADILRGEWEYTGLVMSDWGGANDRVAGLRVGMDLEMPGGASAFDGEIAAAVRDGRLAEADLDRSAARVVAASLRWNAIRGELAASGELVADHDAHHALARRSAAAGTVLLTNDGLLPLSGGGASDADADPGTIAVVGAFAHTPRYQGGGSSKVNPTRVDTLLDALREQVGEEGVRYAPGYDASTGETTPALLAEAASVASTSDAVVLVLGLPSRWETEGLDRADCRLPEAMDHLLEVVLGANPRTAVVVVNGGVVELPWADRPAALVESFLGGQAGGSALADVLLGTVEPGGRLAESIPFHADALASAANFPGLPRQVQYREGLMVGYRFHDTHGVPAHFPFGHGLGYTTIEIGAVQVSGQGPDLSVSVEVCNTGSRAGAQVVQLYVRDVDSTLARPEKELKAFAKVQLDPGESTTVTLSLDRGAFAVWDVASGGWRVEAGEFELLVGTSSADIASRTLVHVDSDDVIAAAPSVAGPVATDAEFAALLGHPVPAPEPARPFTRISTVGDLDISRAGHLVANSLRAVARRQLTDEGLEAGDEMMAAGIAEMPLRTFVQFSGGRLSTGLLDRVLAALNGDVRGLVRPTSSH